MVERWEVFHINILIILLWLQKGRGDWNKTRNIKNMLKLLIWWSNMPFALMLIKKIGLKILNA
jgi:hypothetical protein